MNTRRFLPLLVAALLSSFLVTWSATPAQAVSPSKDYTRLPKSCVDHGDLIPQEPVICKLNTFKPNRPTAVIWGDSHAWMMIPAMIAAAGNKNVNLVATVMGGCPPMDNKLKEGEQAGSCFKSNDQAIKYVKELEAGDQPVRVILGASWQRYRQAHKTHDPSYTGDMARAMQKATPALAVTLSKAGIATDVIGQIATVPEVTKNCPTDNDPYACDVPRKAALKDAQGTRSFLVKAFKPLAGTRPPIDVNPYFCNKRVCHGKVGQTRTWWDDLHISATLARKLRGYLKPTFDTLVAEEPDPGPGPEEPPCTILIVIPC